MSEKTENENKKSINNGEKEKKKKRRGFSGTIWTQLKVLNESTYFKEKYGEEKFKVLLIDIDDKIAALVDVNNGTVDVDGIKYDRKNPKGPEGIKNLIKTTKHNGLLKCDIETFFAIASGKISTGGLIKLVLKGDIRGVPTMLKFAKFFKVIAYVNKQKKNEEEV